MTKRTRQLVAKAAETYNLLIIEDGMYSLLKEQNTAPIVSYAQNHTIYICSLSKSISPGLRFAYLVTPERYRMELTAALYNMNVSITPIMIEAASRLINSNEADLIVEERRQMIKEYNSIIEEYLGKFHIYGDDACMFRWLPLPEAWSGESFELYAMNAGVRLYAAERFTVGSMPAAKAVRISLTSVKDAEELKKGVGIIRSLLEKDERMDFGNSAVTQLL